MDLWLGKVIRVQVHYNVGCPGLEVKDGIYEVDCICIVLSCFVLLQNHIRSTRGKPGIFFAQFSGNAKQGFVRDFELDHFLRQLYVCMYYDFNH